MAAPLAISAQGRRDYSESSRMDWRAGISKTGDFAWLLGPVDDRTGPGGTALGWNAETAGLHAGLFGVIIQQIFV